jgi:hypothetical protein
VGFLHATPESWPKDGPKNRAQQYSQAGKELPIPEFLGGEYLAEAWTNLGRIEINPGLGKGPLRFIEIKAGCPWTTSHEAELIRNMSMAYLDGLRIGSDVLGKPPWEPEDG